MPMDGASYVADKRKAGGAKDFLTTIKLFERTAWNAWPNRHYFGMVTVEQTEGGWMVYVAPIGSGEKVNGTFYSHDDEERLEFDVARKMHPSLICTCSNPNACFEGNCKVKPLPA
jgi:hypothetical protein